MQAALDKVDPLAPTMQDSDRYIGREMQRVEIQLPSTNHVLQANAQTC